MTPISNNRENFIEYDEALALKALGFNLECDYFYISLPNGKHNTRPTKWYAFPENWNLRSSRLSAPTYYQVFSWFTTVKRLHGFVRIGTSGYFSYEIWGYVGDAKGWKLEVNGRSETENSLTQAHTDCLKKLIELTEDSPLIIYQ